MSPTILFAYASSLTRTRSSTETFETVTSVQGTTGLLSWAGLLNTVCGVVVI
jgi:hypothetical protein